MQHAQCYKDRQIDRHTERL